MTDAALGTGATVVMPTFDEVENLEATIGAVRAAAPGIRVLVVDDASPDGTGELADRLAAADPLISVLHRTGREGLGAAYLAGFARALDDGAEVVLEMDADGSHPADRLPALLARLADTERPADLVLGSRWVPGGRIVDWPAHREALSRLGNSYARVALGLPVRDATGGFRAYRADMLRTITATPLDARGYGFQVDLVVRTIEAGGRVAEVPITFRERRFGRSKMTFGIVLEAMHKVTVWSISRRGGTRIGPRFGGFRQGLRPDRGR